MKKTFSILFLNMLMVMCLGFSSCSKEGNSDGDINKKIIGKWQLVENNDEGALPCDFQLWREYKSDGTAIEYDACDNVFTPGKWSANSSNNTLTIINDEFPIPIAWKINSLTDKEMVIEASLLEGYPAIQKYKRIK